MENGNSNEANLKHLKDIRDSYIRKYKNDEITTREFVGTVAEILEDIDEISANQ